MQNCKSSSFDNSAEINVKNILHAIRRGFPEVIVFADHDEAGMMGAFRQVARSGANVEMPEVWKQDWNDVHRSQCESRA